MKSRLSAVLRPVLALSLVVLAQGAAAQTITVSAAASLADAFKEIAQQYETAHPGASVQLNFGASGTLLQQIDKGAPVDVFASADERTMDQAQERGLLRDGTRADFARNSLVLIQPQSSTQPLTSLAALQDAAIRRIAIGNPESVPVGRYTKATLEADGQWAALQDKFILAQNVRQALDYVARAEVDAGFVYGTDAALMPEKVKVSYTVPTQRPVIYPLAVLARSTEPEAAEQFTALVRSPQGQEVLARYGFLPPTAP